MPIRKIRIALIEDSVTVRFFYQSIFEQKGFEVIPAETGLQGWRIIAERKPDIVVLDMMLPDISGLELLKRMRSVEFSKMIPVLALTSVKEISHVQKTLQYGANYYSVKGQDSPEKIQQIIYKLLKRSQSPKMDDAIEGKTDPVDVEDEFDLEFIRE